MRAEWRLTHMPALDGVRGLAIIFVMAAHTQVASLHAAGTVGVTMFFTLSGFLITGLLLQDLDDHGKVRLGHFYARRARRLAPALLLLLGAMAILGQVSDSRVVPDARDLCGALLYVSNYTGAMAGRDTAILHTWSLAVEEQFYLIWPFLLMLLTRVARGRLLAPALVTMAVGSAVGRIVLWDAGAGILRVNYGIDMRLDGLVVGALLAIHLHARGRVSVGRAAVPLVLLGFVGSSFVGVTAELLVVTAVVPLGAALVILAVAGGRAAWLAASPLALLGRRSYAMYLWHYPIFALASVAPPGTRVLAWAVALVVLAAIVHLSWRCVEEPFLKNYPVESGRRLATASRPV